VTLSREQLQTAQARAAEKQLARSANFLLQDYRDVAGPFDRIVSDFKRSAELLADDGVMLLHSIARSEGPDITNPWIAKYIFPGGYLPALSEVLPAIERVGLLVCDIEILRLHYAETLKARRERFQARREEAERLYERAIRADVGILSGVLGNGVPQTEHHGVPDSDQQTPRRGADHAGLQFT
jgi:cyclopropane-fatty-acyl-phospholipid synthase